MGTFEFNAYTKQFSYKTYNEEIYKSKLISLDNVFITSFYLEINKIMKIFQHKIKGCQTFEITTQDLGVVKGQYFYKIFLEASVTESDTSNSYKIIFFYSNKLILFKI